MHRPPIVLTDEVLEQLIQLSETAPARIAKRAWTIRKIAKKFKISKIARELKIDRRTVTNTWDKFLRQGIKGITADAPRIGPRNKRPTDEEIEKVILTKVRPKGKERWPYRSLATELEVPLSTLYRRMKINKIPRSKQDLEMKIYLREHRRISDIRGIFVYFNILAIAFQLEGSKADDKKTQDRILSLRAIEGFQEKNREFIDKIRTKCSAINPSIESKSYMRDFLRFIYNINKQLSQDKEIILIMSSLIVDANNKIGRWFDKNRRFHLRSLPSREQCLDFIYNYIDKTDEQCKRILYYRLENIMADCEMRDILFHDNSIPYSCIFSDREQFDK